ncbi:NAD dependent epimerase/dehydratase family protein [Mycobacterium intracellulare]|nr:NAD dependent epimerase/dehydratase family protein [Mycobacterium intracellulare]
MLRLQNVYGPGQSLTNSYTGIVALFARLARQGLALEVYEDGRIVRDFVYIDAVIDALFAAVERPATQPRCLDIGSGQATTIHELANKIAALCGAHNQPSYRNSATATYAPQVATSSRRSTNSVGIRSGRWTTACARCSTGSVIGPKPRPDRTNRAVRPLNRRDASEKSSLA